MPSASPPSPRFPAISVCQSLLIAVGLVAALLYLTADSTGMAWLPWITKPLPVICLMFLVPAWSARDRYRQGIMAGLLFSAIGDVFMLRQPEWFILGLSSFLIAHVCYIISFSASSDGTKVPLRPFALAPFLLFGAIMVAWLWPGLGGMRGPVMAYVMVILGMGWRAAARIGYDAENRAAQWAGLLGAVSFIISDSIIAANKFHAPVAHAGMLIMLTYWAGQIGIAWSVRRR